MRKYARLAALWTCGLVLLVAPVSRAWEHHPLLTERVLSTMSEVAGAAPVAATPLEDFLIGHEEELAAFLAEEEAWARGNLPSYAPRPDALAFQATGNAADVRARFFAAIRINPDTKTPLYVSPLAGGASSGRPAIDAAEVTLLEDISPLADFEFQALAPGEAVSPLEVAATASNEPDYGMDLGLFTDNGTEHGQQYGFGAQPFGNPGLVYGSQAPFHMGFYHESPIIFFFASFLKKTYPEHRVHLCKSLSEFAFEHGEDYWGWRFMGWGLHYLGDLSMPYHTTVLPGYSTFRMLIVNLLNMLGFPRLQENAVQISSNRHMALEIYQRVRLAEAVRGGDTQHALLSALLRERDIPAYADSLLRKQVARLSYCMSWEVDETIARLMPRDFVSNPSIELADRPDRDQVVDMVVAAHGGGALTELDGLLAEAFEGFAIYGRSYVRAILNP